MYLNGECIFPALLGYPLRSRLQQVIQQSQRLDSDTDFGKYLHRRALFFSSLKRTHTLDVTVNIGSTCCLGVEKQTL